MDKKTIVYVGNFDFPFGNASGKRVYGNGKLLREIGYETIFVGMNNNIAAGTALADTKQVFDGFQYYNYAYPRSSKDWINYKSIMQDFLAFVSERKESIHSIICYGSPRLSFFISGVCRWGKKNNVHVLTDCVDWLESKTGNFVFDVAKTADTLYQKVIANKKADGVICISSYLEKYYRKAGKKTVIIPPLSDRLADAVQTDNQETLQFVYAGNAFKANKKVEDPSALKDRVDRMMELLYALKQKEVSFRFFYYGLDAENYLSAFPEHKDMVSYLGDWIVFCGKRDNAEVVAKIEEADFTILLRDVKKSTMAGFPTKVSESISCGTPVITTRTSDIDMYLQEDREVIFVEQNDLETSAEAIKQLVAEGKHRVMKEKCRGSRIFYYESFTCAMREFIEK